MKLKNPLTALRHAFAPRAALEAAPGDLTAEQLMTALGIGQLTMAGVAVTPELSMRVSTVHSCVSLISGAIASLPLAIYDRTAPGKSTRVDFDCPGPVWWLFNESANEDMTSFDMLQSAIAAKLLHGDGYIEIIRRGPNAMVKELLFHHSVRVVPLRNFETMERFYSVTDAKTGELRIVMEPDMIVLHSIGYDEKIMRSPSVITMAAREAVGTSLAAEAYSAKFFSGGATFDYALKLTGNMKKEQLDALKTSLLSRMESNSRFPLILTGGLEPAQLSVNPKDAEILATRSFSVEDIARFFGVPPHMVGHQEKSTSFGTGIEQQSIGFARYTLMRHIRSLQQEINRKIWPARQRYYAEFDLAELERTDLTSRFNAYRVALGRAGEPGWMTQNEVRSREKQPPISGGDDINQGTAPANGEPPK